ncbi:MAG: PHP domain-containing protein [Oscillatoria sp. PMC 1068.18]|nr:PHP domain-containing protein [Oscillatoria sp. PMC 1076.18]MEC4987341.1 PHP domain-containing protein [Oscillatoria sp. PMC 1068.18]
MLELHCHTTFSDGTLTPTELVAKAAAVGVRALAITDHDTMSGWSEAIAAAKNYNLEIVPGLELSTVENGRSLHILGFYPDPDKLQQPLNLRLEGRKRRAQKMVAKLTALGYPIELSQLPTGIAPGRPHIATALVKAGHVKTTREAFDRWLRDDGVAYVHYEKFSAVEGIQLLRECGAIPVWAHPCLFRGGEVEEILPRLVDAGLMGIEIYHPSHKVKEINNLRQLCTKYNLLVTGGSDYHGPQPDNYGKEGTTLNMLNLPLSLLDPILAARTCVNHF